ncbi:hypothetical protein L596_028889 [Steinernema carpocapsae]|uniref:F-box domain-containing protein n=1 Tax=Steinernema carpocapsae TaxID=34508 RepID=A0A4U5LZP6_STECR|nr:hypothetical protein L596_028889 [Steinernema carpocapsae]
MTFRSLRLWSIRRALKLEKCSVDLNVYDKLPTTSTADDLDFVSDFVILKVLQYLSFQELATLRLVSKRLNNIIQRHSEQLPKVARFGISLIGLPGASISFLGDNYAPEDVALSVRQIDQGLRHVQLRDALSVEEITLDHSSIQMLLRSLRCHVPKFEVFGGSIDVDPPTFTSLIHRWNTVSLSLVDPSLSSPQLINDRFFRVNRQLRHFRADCSDKQMFISLTDATLEKWSLNGNWPTTALFKNCKTRFSNSGVFKLLKGLMYCCRANALKAGASFIHSEPILWDFGILHDSLSDMVSLVKTSFQDTFTILESETELLLFTDDIIPVSLKLRYEPWNGNSDSDC